MDRMRQRSSVVAHIVIPDRLIKVSQSSSVPDEVVEDREWPSDHTSEVDPHDATGGSRPGTSATDSTRDGDIAEPSPARLKQATDSATDDSPPSKSEQAR